MCIRDRFGCGHFGFDVPEPNGDGAIEGTYDADAVTTDVTAVTGCGGLAVLVDEFDDGAIAAAWTVYANSGIAVSETGGRAVMSFDPFVPPGIYGGLYA